MFRSMKVSGFFKKRGAAISFLIIAIILGIMPLLLNAGILSGSSTVIFLGKCMAFAIAAMGIDLIWGYTRSEERRVRTLFRTWRILHGNVP